MTRRNRTRSRDRDSYDRYEPPKARSQPPKPPSKNPFDIAKVAILASIFILGIVVGIAINFGSLSNNPASIESRFQIERQAPNPELCQQFGASAIVSDIRVFLTLNPFSLFLSQPVMQPGCVLRQNNWSILEQQKLVSKEQVRDCKRRMNTFGYTGVLEGSPNIDCIYQNDAAGNLFLKEPGAAGGRPESDNF